MPKHDGNRREFLLLGEPRHVSQRCIQHTQSSPQGCFAMTVLLLSSGGLDSTTVAYWLVEKKIRTEPVFFDYGQHCVEKEWDTLRSVLPKTEFMAPPRRLDISDVYHDSSSRLINEPDLWNEAVDADELYIPY